MNGNVYPKKNDFEFYPRGKIYNTRRRDNYVHFNNRNGNVHYDSFRRQPNSWRVWHAKPRSQAAPPSFAALNPHPPHRNFIPVNFIVTVPNFSDVPPPDLFVFRNSSAKSVKFPSAPATGIPSGLAANKDVEDNLMKSTEAEKDDDIQYLYTVQTKGGELVEFVDLSEDSEKPDSSDKSRASDNLLQSNSTDTSDARESDCSGIITQIPEETVQRSKKQNAARRRGRKRKKPCEDILCDICEREYKFVQSKGQEIFKARCGHMFCQQCLKELDPYKCPECNVYLQKLFKVFL